MSFVDTKIAFTRRYENLGSALTYPAIANSSQIAEAVLVVKDMVLTTMPPLIFEDLTSTQKVGVKTLY